MSYRVSFSVIASVIFLSIFHIKIFAQESPYVVINEFSIEPEQSIELLNRSETVIDLSGWYLDDSGGSTYFSIPNSTLLYPNSCALFHGNFNLNKSSSDTIRLFDSKAPPTEINANMIDSYTYTSSPGMNNSFVRLPDGSDNWSTTSSNFGKFNESGNSCVIIPTETPTLTPTPISTATQTPSPTQPPTPTISQSSHENIYISEVMVAPNTGENEWVELYNDNDFPVSLQDWYIDDVEDGGSSPKIFSINIPAKGYTAFTLSTSIFNNSGDDVRLLDFDGNTKDEVSYSLSEIGKSWGWQNIKNKTFCLQDPTKGSENGKCLPGQISKQSNNEAKLHVVSPTKYYQKNNIYNIPLKYQSTSQSYKIYAVSVTPPNTYRDSTQINDNVRGAYTKYTQKSRSYKVFPFLAISYSLLSVASLAIKMIYS